MIHYKFSNSINREFTKTIRARVNEYFNTHQISKNYNNTMVIKTIMALSMYLIPYFLIVFGGFSNIPLLFGLWAIMGFGVAFVGTSVMHDALHGAYAKNRLTNKIIGWSAAIIGAEASVWKLQHNVLHHTYTNIEHADEDIESRYVLRFTPHQPLRWFHRYQHMYVTFLYGLSTLIWTFFKDYYKLYNYKKKGLIKSQSEYRKLFWRLLPKKIALYMVILVIPIIALPIPAWITVLMFVTMHFVAGVLLSVTFQLAHVMPTSKFEQPETEVVDENWFIHQLFNTSNFAMNNKIVTWFMGGLNFQIEHHLFPNICHIHYPKIAKIVEKTAKEFQLPYYYHESLGKAIKTHYEHLRQLGRTQPLQLATA